MSDQIKAHLQGYAATLSALDLIRRGVAPDEATTRLLIDLAGKDCLDVFADKEIRSLSNKLNHAAQNLAKAAHAAHAVFAEALELNGVIEPASRAPTNTSAERRRVYQRDLMRRRRAKARAEREATAAA
jgi:hypothetical protein